MIHVSVLRERRSSPTRPREQLSTLNIFFPERIREREHPRTEMPRDRMKLSAVQDSRGTYILR